MNERRRDLFLWLWSQRRKRGLAAVRWRGAAIGALGGVAFALLMMTKVDTGGRTGLAGLIAVIERAGIVLALAVAMFGVIGYMLAIRVFSAHEAMYQRLLASGARVPEQKPAMTPGDRGPAIAVFAVATVIALFLLYLFVRLG